MYNTSTIHTPLLTNNPPSTTQSTACYIKSSTTLQPLTNFRFSSPHKIAYTVSQHLIYVITHIRYPSDVWSWRHCCHGDSGVAGKALPPGHSDANYIIIGSPLYPSLLLSPSKINISNSCSESSNSDDRVWKGTSCSSTARLVSVSSRIFLTQ